MIFSYDCLSPAELGLCCQVAFSFSKANSKLDKGRQLWPSCNYFSADACMLLLPVHLLVNIPRSCNIYLCIPTVYWGSSIAEEWRMTGFTQTFGGSWRGRICLLLISYLHKKVKYKRHWVLWVNPLKQEVMKTLKQNVQVNDAKYCKSYFALWIIYSPKNFFFKFPIFSLPFYSLVTLFASVRVHSIVIFLVPGQMFFHYPFPLESLGSSAQCFPHFKSVYFGYSWKSPYRKNNHFKAQKNFNKYYLVILISDYNHLRIFVEIHVTVFFTNELNVQIFKQRILAKILLLKLLYCLIK